MLYKNDLINKIYRTINKKQMNYISQTHNAVAAILQRADHDKIVFPTWKLMIKDEEYETLKLELKNAYALDVLESYSLECAIYFAEWWKREFKGGKPKIENVANSLGITDYHLFFKVAREVLEVNKIRIIRTAKNKQPFRTLLLQGGLPLSAIYENHTKYSEFLKHLLKECLINDIETYKDIPTHCIQCLPDSFQNDEIYDLSLAVVKAIISGDSSRLPFNDSDTKARRIKEALEHEYKYCMKDKVKSHKIGELDWSLEINDSKLRLYFVYMASKQIACSKFKGLDVENTNEVRIMVNNRCLAKYKKHQEYNDLNDYTEYFILTDRNSEVQYQDNFDYIDIRAVDDKGMSIVISLPNSTPPDFDYPQTFQHAFDNVYKQLDKPCGNTSIIIYKEPWSIVNGEIQHSFNFLDGVMLHGAYFKCDIELKHTEEDRVVEFSNKHSSYTVNFPDAFVPWVLKSNFKVIDRMPSIVVYSKDSEIVQASNYTCYFKDCNSSDWKEINRYSHLHTGPVTIKVCLADQTEVYEKFFFIGELNYTLEELEINTGIINWNNTFSKITPNPTPDLEFKLLKNSMWELSSYVMNKRYPYKCSFIIKNMKGRDLLLTVPSPFKGTHLVNSQGISVVENEDIPLDMLYKYRLVMHGHYSNTVCFSHESVTGVEFEHEIHEGFTCLSDFQDSIDRLLTLYGFRFKDTGSVVLRFKNIDRLYKYKIRLSTKRIEQSSSRSFKVRHNKELDVESSLSSQLSQFQNLFLETFEDAKSQGNIIYGCDSDIFSDSTEVFELVKKEQNEYCIPESIKATRVTLFSHNNEEYRIIPRTFVLDESLERSIGFTQGKKLLKEKLLDCSIESKAWSLAYEYFEIATVHEIPYSTFSLLSVIASDETLFARLVIEMILRKIDDPTYLQRYCLEYGIMVHWITPEAWRTILVDKLGYFSPELIGEIKFYIEPELSRKYSDYIFHHYYNSIIPDEKLSAINGSFSPKSMNAYRGQIYGKQENNADLPKQKIPLRKKYWDNISLRVETETMIRSPLYVAETLCGVQSFWEWMEKNYTLRRVLLFHNVYFNNLYTEILYNGLIVNQ